jgi:hypothetical protein
MFAWLARLLGRDAPRRRREPAGARADRVARADAWVVNREMEATLRALRAEAGLWTTPAPPDDAEARRR